MAALISRELPSTKREVLHLRQPTTNNGLIKNFSTRGVRLQPEPHLYGAPPPGLSGFLHSLSAEILPSRNPEHLNPLSLVLLRAPVARAATTNIWVDTWDETYLTSPLGITLTQGNIGEEARSLADPPNEALAPAETKERIQPGELTVCDIFVEKQGLGIVWRLVHPDFSFLSPPFRTSFPMGRVFASQSGGRWRWSGPVLTPSSCHV